jgi:hypothetical protein
MKRPLALLALLLALTLPGLALAQQISPSPGAGGGGTVSIVSVTTANGVSGTVANATTTPAISLNLGAINPTSVGLTTSGSAIFSTTTEGTANDGALNVSGNASLSGTTSFTGPVVLTSTAKGFPFPEIPLRATTTDTTGDITPGNYTPAAGSNAIIGIPGYNLLGGVTSGTATLTLTAMLPPVIPQGTLYLRQRYLTLSALTSGTVKATVSDAVVTNGGNPFTVSLNAETQTSLGATTTDTFVTVDTPLTATATANGVVVINYQLNQTSTANDWFAPSVVIK